MDEADIANDLAQAEREAAVQAQLAAGAAPRCAPRHDRSGRRICVMCARILSPQRLAAVPHAVACTHCESADEHRQRQNRSKRAWAP